MRHARERKGQRLCMGDLAVLGYKRNNLLGKDLHQWKLLSLHTI